MAASMEISPMFASAGFDGARSGFNLRRAGLRNREGGKLGIALLADKS
jgi:hypothetical protein